MESTHNLQIHHAEDTQMGEGKKLPYPKTVFFIVVTEFCERFAYYGMRAVLTVYMRNVLNFSDDLATSIYHVFLFLCYFLPLFGAVLADSFMGKYRTVLLLSSIFAVGNFLLTAASVPPLNLPVTAISLTGLFLMAVGTGGIKPCVAPLGGDQFILPQQERQLRQFFSVFTFAVSVGNMCSTLLTPILRNEVTCFNQDCYPLAFGVPAGLMIVAVGIFMIGRPFYIVNKPKDNIILRVFQCMIYAVSQRKQRSKEIEERSSSPKKHWVDYAYHKGSKFDKQLVEDTKGLLRVLVYYLPVPMFWALYEQLGSRWTIQATRMDGNLGSFSIQPDQMQVANAILMFTFIPIFETVLYPLLRKCNVFRRPLQRMVVGGLLASLSFLLAGLVEMRIEGTDLRLPAVNQTHLMVVNTLACPVHCDIKRQNSTEGHQSYFEVQAQFNTILRSIKERNLELRCRTAAMTVGDNGGQCSQTPTEFFSAASNKTALTWSGSIRTLPGKLQALIITRDCEGMTLKVHNLNRSEDTTKSKEGHSKLSIIGLDSCAAGANSTSLSVTVTGDRDEYLSLTNITQYLAPPIDLSLRPGRYSIKSQFDSLNPLLAENATEIVDLRTGGNYMMIFMRSANDLVVKVQLVTIIQPNKIHMLWLLPQYILMAWGEILFIISGMEFSFTEAPVSMKSVLQSCWHLSNACGNLMVIIAAQNKGKNSQATEFFIFASLMFVDSIVFGFMASRYKYVNLGDTNNGHDEGEGGTERKQSASAPILSNGNEETRF